MMGRKGNELLWVDLGVFPNLETWRPFFLFQEENKTASEKICIAWLKQAKEGIYGTFLRSDFV
jgi:hypothetical protein